MVIVLPYLRSRSAELQSHESAASGWPRSATVFLAVVVCFGIYLRFTGLLDVFYRGTDELAEVMPGIRLHALPFFNLRDPIRYNFFQSMFYSQHGLGDVSFYYLMSGGLALLGLPIAERFLFMAGAVTNLGLALAGAMMASRVLRSRGTGYVFVALVMVSPFYVFVSQSGWARTTWTPLLLLMLFLFQWKAMRSRGVVWSTLFCVLGGFVSLTDGLVMLPMVPILGLFLADGGLAKRIRQLLRDRVFVAGMLTIAFSLGVNLLIGLAAIRRGTDLTVMAYLLLRGGHGGLIPSGAVLSGWAGNLDQYLALTGGWLLVASAFLVAAWDGLRGRPIGFVAAWWALASAGVIRYGMGQEARGGAAEVVFLSAFQLALPSFLLVAWLIASIAEGRVALMWRLAPQLRRSLSLALLLSVTGAMAFRAFTDQRNLVYKQASPLPGGERHKDWPADPRSLLNTARMVKAAAFYVRSHGPALPYVFQLDSSLRLGHIGEFYYGLSYGRGLTPEDPNHLLDFGRDQFGRPAAPESLYRAYGVTSFDYYVDFADTDDEFRAETIYRLLGAGARVVCTISDGENRLGRILSFRDEPPISLDYWTAAKAWDWTFAKPRALLLQPLAGTAYHFGYNWRAPE